jgi:glycosyltransferase involved in cell wall biosynthesis
MKVLLSVNILPHYRAGLVRELKRRNFQISFLGSPKDVTKSNIKTIPGFINPTKDVAFGPFYWQQGLLGHILWHSYDAIVFTGNFAFLSTWVAVLVAKIKGQKVVFHTHGWLEKEYGFKGWVRNCFYHLADSLLLYGETAREIGRANGFSGHELRVIYNSIDYDAQKKARSKVRLSELRQLKKDIFGNSQKTVIVVPSRVTAARRLDMLVRAVSMIDLNQRPGLIVVGDGPLRSRLEQLAKELNVALFITGECYDENIIARYVMAASVCIIPGNAGLSVMHALGYGCPVITHNNSAEQMPEFEAIRPGFNGDLFKQNDIIDLLAKMRPWLSEGLPSKIVRERCYKVIEEKYNPGTQAKLIFDALSALVDKPQTMKPEDMRLLVGFDYVGPYHDARIKAACKRGRVSILQMSGRDKGILNLRNLSRDYDLYTLHPIDAERMSWGKLVDAIESIFGRVKPDVVAVPGYSLKSALALIYVARKWGLPIVLMSDSNYEDEKRNGFIEGLKGAIIGGVGAGFVAGHRSAEYLVSLGLPRENIFKGYDVVDNKHFSQPPKGVKKNGGFLYIGRFVEKKNVFGLLKAYAKYCKNSGDSCWPLTLVGDGVLAAKLKAEAIALGINERITWCGQKDYKQIVREYHRCKALVLPSYVDQWGLVVNEAMAAGLPILVSRHCGSSAELVENGVNGFVFDPHDTDVLANLMQQLASSGPAALAKMGRASQKRIAYLNLSVFARGLWGASHTAKICSSTVFPLYERLLIRLVGMMRGFSEE